MPKNFGKEKKILAETELSSFPVFPRALPTPTYPSWSLLVPDVFAFAGCGTAVSTRRGAFSVSCSASAAIRPRNCVLSSPTRVLLGFTRFAPAARISRLSAAIARSFAAAVIAGRSATGRVTLIDSTVPVGFSKCD